MNKLLVPLLFTMLVYIQTQAQELTADANTLLLLHCNNNVNGASGEVPTTSTGIGYAAGIFDKAMVSTASTSLSYPALNNINATAGTFEAWVQPFWDGGDGQTHALLSYGGGGGILIEKDGGNYLKIIVNRYGWGPGGNPEMGTGIPVGNWVAGTWYHVAFTWTAGATKLYVNGELAAQQNFSFALPAIGTSNFDITHDNGGNTWNGLIEELRISNVPRTAAEIQNSFLAGLNITGIVLKENNVSLYPHWRYDPQICVTTPIGNIDMNADAFVWSSFNPGVATINSDFLVETHSPGNVVLQLTKNGVSASLNIQVETPAILPQYENNMDATLLEPAPCSKRLMPVVIINYVPTTDGIYVDLEETGPIPEPSPLAITALNNRVKEHNIQMKFMVEERSKFRGYKDPAAEPYLGYYVVDYITVYEPIPRLKPTVQGDGTGSKLIDYWAINERFNMQDYVENKGVKEVWLLGYHTDEVVGWESNMSSPLTGDISNSDRSNDDLQIYDKTYMAYWFNYSREAGLHNQGHQLESIFMHVNNLQDGNANLFLNDFVGWQNGNPPLGRCGDTHHPPNTTVDYDYYNMTLVASDIEDWRPSGGTTKLVNADTWGSIAYDWPYNNPPNGETEANYYMYWMQNMPGYQNTIPYNANFMTNWWEFIADWDASISNGLGLYAPNATGLTQSITGACTNCQDIMFVNPIIFDGLYQAAEEVHSNGKVLDDVETIFKAGNCINLEAGFEVPLGSDFKGMIESCN